MLEFFDFLVVMWERLCNLLETISFNLGGLQVGLFSIFLGFLVFSIIIKVFWKGA